MYAILKVFISLHTWCVSQSLVWSPTLFPWKPFHTEWNRIHNSVLEFMQETSWKRLGGDAERHLISNKIRAAESWPYIYIISSKCSTSRNLVLRSHLAQWNTSIIDYFTHSVLIPWCNNVPTQEIPHHEMNKHSVLMEMVHNDSANIHSLTHRGRDKMAVISQTTFFSNVFSWMVKGESLFKSHWNMFTGVQSITNQHCFI